MSDGRMLLGINLAMWLVSLLLGKTWPVDFIWSLWPLLQCALISSRTPGISERQLCVGILVALWGVRLTLNFVRRGGIGHEDWRYTAMRHQFGAHFWWVSIFSVFLGQSVFMFAACLSLYGAMLSPAKLQASDVLGASICCVGVLLELISDRQMDAFQASRSEHRTDALVIDHGLWLWSRHPNYAGEVAWWWGVFLLSTSSGAPRWVLAGPCGITILITFVSVKLLEDRQLQNKGEAYRSYRRRVPSSLLPIPPVLNPQVSRWLTRPATTQRKW